MTERPAWINQSLHALTWDVLRPYVVVAAVGVIALASCTMAHSEPAPGRDGYSGVQTRARISQSVDANGNVIGGRPAECHIRIRGRLIPYCGCSVSLKVFGKPIPELFLAANWKRKFPHTSPAAGMVAARNGHVMILVSHVGGSEWEVFDPNSGGGLTRQHVRSIRGFKIVNPHGAYAENAAQR